MVLQMVVGLVPHTVLGTSLGKELQTGLVVVWHTGLVMVVHWGTLVQMGTDTQTGLEIWRGVSTVLGLHTLLVSAWQLGADV